MKELLIGHAGLCKAAGESEIGWLNYVRGITECGLGLS